MTFISEPRERAAALFHRKNTADEADDAEEMEKTPNLRPRRENERIVWTNGSNMETVVIIARSERTASVSSGPQLRLRAEKGMKSMPAFFSPSKSRALSETCQNKTVSRKRLLNVCQ
jgi:hypothetical protein